jgi:hypothetical protein
MRTNRWRLLLTGAAVLCSGLAHGQLLNGGVGGVTAGVGALTNPLLNTPSAVTQGVQRPAVAIVNDLGLGPATEGLDAPSLLDLRRRRLRALIEANHSQLEADRAGAPVRRGEVIAMDVTPADLARAEAAGFRRLRQDTLADLGLSVTVLAPPRGKSAAEGLKMIRELDPGGAIELNHVFEPAGAGLNAYAEGVAAAGRGASAGATIGMVDGGVAAHPCLASASIEQRGFTPGGPKPTGHGTAIASLLVGSDGTFEGAARGHPLLVADVYGGQAAAGSAEAIVDAFGWLAQRRVEVVTISLVGPANSLLQRGVEALRARGILVVAAVGNDGPAAPPLYPASYPGVVAVTAVDARDRALLEAGHALHLDFAAPGADMAAAAPGRGFSVVRGTSFAAPLVAARLALAGGDAGHALAAVDAEAVAGHGQVGRGVVCDSCRNDPHRVHAQK